MVVAKDFGCLARFHYVNILPSGSLAGRTADQHSKGLLWLANANVFPINFQTARMQIHMRPSKVPFLFEYMTNRGLLQEENLKNTAQSMKMIEDGKWTEKNGDTHSEPVFTGVGLKKMQ